MTDAHPFMACKFDAIYNVGDSMSNTDNLVRENSALPFARLPYSKTLFKNATGRCSNGLLMIDYIALVAGVPFLHPYLNKDVLFLPCLGENFVVAACLNDQDCVKKRNKALFMVREIGGKDYNYAFFQGKPVDEIKAMVLEVVQTIKENISLFE
ncbi:acetylajmalan esterase-like [Juglans microcarpa x Juglans regia]|uniref:acetylajmalan esterase-like n=1 Tax=Juglans microcarpa x Juglans regia TaxID=2249226 RepID=UPI001B7E4957|nr:acetylajmalan esterase-like [Juglans microcarpa x Juglans regia]